MTERLPLKRSSPSVGYVAILLSIVFFTIQGLVLRGARENFGPSTAMFWRSVVGLALVLLVAPLLRLPLRGRRIDLLLLRGIAGSFSLLLFFTSIDRIDLGTATALCYTYPVFGSLLSAVFLKERLSRRGWMAIVVAWIGIAIAIGFRPSVGAGEFYGLGGGILAGVAVHSIRALRRAGESISAILFYFFTCGILLALPGGFAESPTLGIGSDALPALLVVGLAATLGQALLTLAYKHLPTRTGASISLIVVPLSMLGAWLLFGEPPVHGAVWGGLLFGGAILYIVIRESDAARESPGG